MDTFAAAKKAMIVRQLTLLILKLIRSTPSSFVYWKNGHSFFAARRAPNLSFQSRTLVCLDFAKTVHWNRIYPPPPLTIRSHSLNIEHNISKLHAFIILHISITYFYSVSWLWLIHVKSHGTLKHFLNQCFSTAGTRPGTWTCRRTCKKWWDFYK